MENEKIVFDGIIHQIGGSLALLIPPEIAQKLQLKKHSRVKITLDKKDDSCLYGLFWKANQ